MHYLSSFGSIELTKHLLRNPAHSPTPIAASSATSSRSHLHAVWENLEKSQSKNVEKSMRSLMWKSHVMSACAWELLGNWDMALYACQVILSFFTSYPSVTNFPLFLFIFLHFCFAVGNHSRGLSTNRKHSVAPSDTRSEFMLVALQKILFSM